MVIDASIKSGYPRDFYGSTPSTDKRGSVLFGHLSAASASDFLAGARVLCLCLPTKSAGHEWPNHHSRQMETGSD